MKRREREGKINEYPIEMDQDGNGKDYPEQWGDEDRDRGI